MSSSENLSDPGIEPMSLTSPALAFMLLSLALLGRQFTKSPIQKESTFGKSYLHIVYFSKDPLLSIMNNHTCIPAPFVLVVCSL